MNIEVKEIRACKFANSLFVARHEGSGESGGIILGILSLCNKLWEWSASRLGLFTPGGESPVHIKQKAGRLRNRVVYLE